MRETNLWGGEVVACIGLLKPRRNLPNLFCAVLSR